MNKMIDDKEFKAKNWTDENGCHQGGQSYGPGFCIAWQRGPLLGQFADNQNGALLITVLSAVLHQLRYFQDSKFACDENASAISYIELALSSMEARKNKRKVEGILGTTETS